MRSRIQLNCDAMNNFYAYDKTPAPLANWLTMSRQDRISLVTKEIEMVTGPSMDGIKALNVVDAKEDGQVIVQFAIPVDASKRGTILLDFEALLKLKIDPALAVWLEPLGDKNSLRNLRGIEVKS
jgi:hypothetical protein